jgi:MFS family permease
VLGRRVLEQKAACAGPQRVVDVLVEVEGGQDEVGAGTGIAWLTVVLAFFGCSVGFNNLGLQAAMERASPESMLGTASGLFMTSRYFGTILSGSLLGIVFAERVGSAELHTIGFVIVALSAGTLAFALRSARPATMEPA